MKILKNLTSNLKDLGLGNPKIRAIYLGGSQARGQSDSLSDIDVCILWDQIPNSREREKLFQQLGFSQAIVFDADQDPIENVADHFLFQGIKVDINSLLFENIFSFAHGLRRIDHLSFELHELAYALQSAVPLFGNETIGKIKDVIGLPTDHQRFWALQRLLENDWVTELNRSLQREDWPSYYKILSNAYQDLFRAACISEYKFYPGSKRHKSYESHFKTNWLEAIRDLWKSPPDQQVDAVTKTLNKFEIFLNRGMI